MYAIAGVTGNTGSVVANALLDKGENVRVIVRDAKKAEAFARRGAEVAIADIDDVESLKRAVAGAKGVYALVPPDMVTEDPIGRGKRIVDNWARAVGDTHTVFLSSVGAQHATGTGPIQYLHSAERSFRNATFIRAAYFIENWGSVLGAAKGDGVLPTFEKPDTRFSMVATRDIAENAARALLEGKAGVIELAGPADLTPAEVASTVGKLLGREVKPIHVSGDAIVSTLTGFGISKAVSSLFREMAEAIDNGRVDWETKNVTRGTTSAETVLRTLLQR